MFVKEIMTDRIQLVSQDANLIEASRLMRDQDVGCLPVTDGSSIIGMLTDRDIVTHALALGKDPYSAFVREAMTPSVARVLQTASIEDAVAVMKDQKIRRLLVVDANDRVCGILSLGDLAQHLENLTEVAKTLETITKSSENQEPQLKTV